MSNRNSVSKTAWSGKTAIVVGASSGLGQTLAERLATQGAARIVLVARDASRLAATARQLAEKWPGTRFTPCAADVSAAAGIAALQQSIAGLESPPEPQPAPQPTSQIESRPGPERDSQMAPRIDLLINAVGLSDRGSALKLTGQRLDELMRANVHAPLLVVQSLVASMPPGGVIVNIGSLSSYFAPRYLGGYSLAKHALRALTQQLRLELNELGLHVMLVCPGPITRSDGAAPRYAQLPTAGDVPAEALAAAGGAKLRGLDPVQLADEILSAAAKRQIELIRPRKARWLVWLIALCPSWGESWLKRMTR